MLRMDSGRRWRELLLLAGLLLLVPMDGLAIQTTSVQGIVYRADGSLAQGTMLVSWPAFTAADGSTIAAGNTSATIAPNGSVSMTLTPNAGANPQGTYYTVVYHMNDGTVEKEYWVVPQAATATISEMRARVVPAAVAQQSVTQQYVDTSIIALQGSYLQLKGGTMNGSLNLSGDPTDALQAATKEYVDSHAGGATLPTDALVFGTSSTAARAATHADVSGLYSSTAYTLGTSTEISTTFKEGTSGATIIGANPSVDLPGSAWVQSGSNAQAVFNSGGGATFGPASVGHFQSLLNVGYSSGTYTLSNVVINGTNSWQFYFNVDGGSGVAPTHGLVVQWSGGGAILVEDVGNTVTTLATGSVGSTLTGNIIVTINGQSVSVNFFGTVLTGTIPAGSPTLALTNFGMNPDGTVGPPNSDTVTLGGFSFVATAANVASTVACSGFYNSDGTCSTPGTSQFAVTDTNGHLVSLPEKGVAPGTQGASPTIAWQDDLNAGIYDPRDPRWGSQATPALQAAAIQAMSNQMACDLYSGKVSQAVAKFPQGIFYVDKLQVAPGSHWEGVATSQGGTQFHSLYNNHPLVQAGYTMGVTCPGGNAVTLTAAQTYFSHFTLFGCASGACSNAPGDTGNYVNGGPYNNGIEMAAENGVVEWVTANSFGSFGIDLDGQDTKAFHNTLNGDLQWLYYGGYKGVIETAAGPETSVATTGSTGSVALSWPAVTGANGYVVYRGSTSGGENAFYFTTTNSFTDTGATAAGTYAAPNYPVITAVSAPAAPTATAGTSGTLAAGTYYYVVTAYQNDGWHGSMTASGTDSMVDWAEIYGLFDAPTVFTFHHLADFVGDGGNSHYDHLWPQLGLTGIADPYGSGGDIYENVRIDFTRLEGIWASNGIQVNGGVIDGGCTATNAATINTGQDGLSGLAGTCVQLLALAGGSYTNLGIGDNNGYGPTYKTADAALFNGATAHNVVGTNPQNTYLYTSLYGVLGPTNFEPETNAPVSVTGPTPNVEGIQWLNPADTTATSYTGFLQTQVNQDFYVQGGNSYVTLVNSGKLVLCGGQNINLGTINGQLHFRTIGGALYGGTGYVAEVCQSVPPPATIASSEAVAYSAMPIFSPAARASLLTLTGNVTSFTLAAGADGQEKTLMFCQNATGGYTVATPANVRGFMTVGTMANKCSSQHFTYSAAQSAWLADSPGVLNE